jgi:hypothetical protein
MNGESGRFCRAITVAGLLNILGLILVLLSLFMLTPITLIVSVTFGGILIGVALLIYIYVVIQDLKMRKVI